MGYLTYNAAVSSYPVRGWKNPYSVRSPNALSADPYATNIVLWLEGNGENNSPNIIDSSPNQKPLTLSGNTRISTAQGKYGGSSIQFDGGLRATNVNEDLTLGTGDFTIEGWFYFVSLGIFVLFEWRNLPALQGLRPTIYTNGSNLVFYAGGDLIIGNSALTTNEFIHIALSKKNNLTKLFVNGIQRGSNYVDQNNYLAPTDGSVTIGALANESFFLGLGDSIRITKGVGRYGGNFNPDTETYLNS